MGPVLETGGCGGAVIGRIRSPSSPAFAAHDLVLAESSYPFKNSDLPHRSLVESWLANQAR
jgi:hypothetical protein